MRSGRTSASCDATGGRFAGTGKNYEGTVGNFAGTGTSCGVTSVSGIDPIGQRGPDLAAAVDASRGLPLNA